MADSTLWWRDGIIYQIYPRSFADSNGDGFGDLPGICSRLDYLAELGVDAIWLSPIYPSPDADFGYDVSDYTAIDPRFGTMADFDQLVAEAHQRGIHIVLDLVLNHTSDQHPWFIESRSSRDNPRRDWYIWRDGKNGGPPNNWESEFGGRGWEFDPATGQYYFHMFVKQQPDLNWRNPQVRQAMLDVFRFWLDRGVDGFRLDVFNVYFKHPDFPDNPPCLGIRGFDRQRHIYDIDQPEMLDFLCELRSLLDSYPERYAVGETFIATPKKAAGYCGSNRLHAAFNFAFTASRWNPRSFINAIERWENALGKDNWPNYVLNNHDLPRSTTRYFRGGDEEGPKVAAALLLTLRGTPFLYYGEEIGMRNIHLRRNQILDPVGKRYWPIYVGRDGCRSPMQWDDSTHAGFSTGTPWLPVNPDFSTRNVDAQRTDPDSLLHFYQRLIAVRRKTPALQRGSFQPFKNLPPGILAYLRADETQIVLVVLNFRQQVHTLTLPQELRHPGWDLLLSNRREAAPDLCSGSLLIAPQEACLLSTHKAIPK